MSINHPFSRLKIKRRGGTPAPTPEPTVQIEFNPNHILLMADSVIESPSQRTTLQNDVIAIHTNTSGAKRPDIAANISWVDTEGALGVYDFTIVNNLVDMCKAINIGCGLDPDDPNGAKAYLKFFLRNYSSNTDGSSKPSVPVYMQSVSGSTYNTDSTTGAYPGAGVNSNGEYQGFLGAGVGAGNLTRQAKIWVPEVAIRFREWMKAFGAYCNDLPQIGGFIINETSVLSAANQAASGGNPAVFYGTTLANPGKPTADYENIIKPYFQNYWQAIIDARPSWSKKEFFVSVGHPVATIYTDQPLNPGVMFTNYAIGEYVQDGYEIYSYTPKDAVQRIAKNVQPYAAEINSYMSYVSGDVRRHRGVDSTQTGDSTSTHSASNGTKVFVIANPGSKTFTVTTGATPRRIINLVANRNEATQVSLRGTVEGWNSTTGNLTVNITSFTGSGSRSVWEVAEVGASSPDYLPPSTLDAMVRGACTARASFPWSAHKFDGATHIAYQVNTTAKTGATENSRNYIDYLDYIENTDVVLQTARPANLDNHVW